MPPVDAGSISASVRIKLSELNADIVSCKTAIDNLGTEFAANAEKYSTLAGKKYTNSLKTIATEMKNVEGAAKAGALSEQQAVQRLIDLRQRELQILQNKAVKEGTASAETVAAIRKTEQALLSLEEKQKLLAGSGGGGGLAATFAKIRDVMWGPIAAAKEFIAVLQSLKAKADEMENEWAAAAEAGAILKNALKTTGAEAWTTKEHLDDMASSLQSATKFGDETITSMQGVLLGFRNIQGANFDHATEAVLDMATVMKMDLTAAAQAVGKALDNPALGLDSLSKQGFKFTQQEKETMKAMQEAGNIAGAQAIILKELDKTYGGAAKAAGDLDVSLRDKLKNAMGDVNEEIGRSISRGLAPFREQWLRIAEAVGAAAKAQNDFKEALKGVETGIGTSDLQAQEKASAALLKRLGDLSLKMKEYRSVGGNTGEMVYKKMEKEYEALNNTRNGIIDNIAALREMEDRKRKAAEADEKAAAAEEVKAAAAALKLEITKARNDLEDEYRKKLVEIDRELKAGVIDAKTAGDERQGALKSEITGLTGLVDKYNLTEDATFRLRAAKTELYAAGLKNAEGAKVEAKATIDAAKNALEFQAKYAKQVAEDSAATNKSIDEATASYRKQTESIKESGMATEVKVEYQRAQALAMADAYEAEGKNVTALRTAINEYFDLLEKSETGKKLEKEKASWEDYYSAVKEVITGIADALGSMYDAELEEIEARYERERELIENNGKTKEQSLQDELAAAISAGDAEAEAEARKKLALFELDKKYEKDKAQIQYKADLVAWQAKGLTLAADTAVAIMKAWADGGLILAGIAAAAGIVQGIAWGSAKPQPPAMATGGIVLPSGQDGTMVAAGDKGGADIMFGTSAMGQPLMQAFAAQVAAAVVEAMAGRSGGGQPLIVQLTLDGKVIAESTVTYINDGGVRLNR
jgi:hypothetical protein